MVHDVHALHSFHHALAMVSPWPRDISMVRMWPCIRAASSYVSFSSYVSYSWSCDGVVWTLCAEFFKVSKIFIC